jgi:hypothetical protein
MSRRRFTDEELGDLLHEALDAFLAQQVQQLVARGARPAQLRLVVPAVLTGNGNALALKAGISADDLRDALEEIIAKYARRFTEEGRSP